MSAGERCFHHRVVRRTDTRQQNHLAVKALFPCLGVQQKRDADAGLVYLNFKSKPHVVAEMLRCEEGAISSLAQGEK